MDELKKEKNSSSSLLIFLCLFSYLFYHLKGWISFFECPQRSDLLPTGMFPDFLSLRLIWTQSSRPLFAADHRYQVDEPLFYFVIVPRQSNFHKLHRQWKNRGFLLIIPTCLTLIPAYYPNMLDLTSFRYLRASCHLLLYFLHGRHRGCRSRSRYGDAGCHGCHFQRFLRSLFF